jgi:BirA family biotin operon repressor/biotin-[acetyl-CoA-carboxylase] ligase
MTKPLDAARIAELCAATRNGLAIEVTASTGSTNADLRQRIDQLRTPVLLAAEEQTAGRGRAGRSWVAAPGDSLCFSLAWPFDGSVARLAGLPLAVGVALADALRAHGHPVTLKWPNDLLLNSAKLGGILVETAAARNDGQSALWAVIGIGLNVHPNASRDAGVGNEVAALGKDIDRQALLASLADALVAALALFDAQGLAPFVDRWQRWHAYAGLPVVILEQDKVLKQGIPRGIDAQGCLLLETDEGLVPIAAGDVSLRAHAPAGV